MRPTHRKVICTDWKEIHTYKRDQHILKETNTHKKRRTDMKKALHIWKRPTRLEANYTHEMRPTRMERDPCKWKETYAYEKRTMF